MFFQTFSLTSGIDSGLKMEQVVKCFNLTVDLQPQHSGNRYYTTEYRYIEQTLHVQNKCLKNIIQIKILEVENNPSERLPTQQITNNSVSEIKYLNNNEIYDFLLLVENLS